MDTKSTILINRGYAKGFKIHICIDEKTRPTKSIVKKTLFDILYSEIAHLDSNIIFIECFSGSGQIGLSALSVGVNECIFFEKDKNAFNNLLKNVNNFKKRFLDSKISTFNIDFFESKNILENTHGMIIMYIDPPFNIRKGYDDIYKKLNIFIESFSEKIKQKIAIIVLEISSDVGSNFLDDIILQNFEIYRNKKFGKTRLLFLKNRILID